MRMILTTMLCLVALLGAEPARAQSAGYRVIVNAANSTTELSRTDVARIFLKKRTTWQNGSEIMVVDQSERSPTRARFSAAVLGRDVAAIKNYWQQTLFSGRGVPPIEEASEAKVVAYVAANPGAIAYVSPAAELPSTVRAVQVSQ
jgi:ABC-type phosphate transport system substrate-binding protein